MTDEEFVALERALRSGQDDRALHGRDHHRCQRGGPLGRVPGPHQNARGFDTAFGAEAEQGPADGRCSVGP